MFEKKLLKLLEEANIIRQEEMRNHRASYYNDYFPKLENFLFKQLDHPLFQKRNAQIVVNHFDEILPFFVSSNNDIILSYAQLLIKQPHFKEKFIEGLKKYPYKNEINDLFQCFFAGIDANIEECNRFFDHQVLSSLTTLDLNDDLYANILNLLNEEKQEDFLNLLIENHCTIPYASIEYKGNNKQIIYDHISSLLPHEQKLYDFMNFAKENPTVFSKIKEYIDHHPDQAIHSLLFKIRVLKSMDDPALEDVIRLLILDIMRNEKVNFSDITFSEGGYSNVFFIGDKVVKIGNRETKRFPNNPYIVAPLLRKELKSNGRSCFIEVTERVDTSTPANKEELYQLYKKLRDLGLIWTDIKNQNVGRLRKENIIHWNENLNPSLEVLTFSSERGNSTLKAGDFVILDADFIFDEKAHHIDYANRRNINNEFEKRYEQEKKEETAKEFEKISEEHHYEMEEQRGIHR